MRFVRFLLTLILLPGLMTCGGAEPDSEITTRLDALFDHLEQHKLFRGAALVSDGGQVVFSTARGLANEAWNIPNTVHTRYRIASLSKQFAAVVVLQLIDEHRLSLEDPLDTYLSGLPESWSGTVEVQHLLNQTTGIPDYTLLPDYMEVLSKGRFTRDAFFRIICDDDLFATLGFVPGEDWEYSNTNYFLLGVLAETVAGVPYEELVEQRIFVPLEMSDSGIFDSLIPVPMLAEGYDLTCTDEVERAAHSEFSPKSVPSGGLYSTVSDLLKWSAALHDGRLLSSEMQGVFTTPTHLVEDETGYACGQWCEFYDSPDHKRVKIFSHGGSIMGMSTWLLRVPDDDRCVVLLHNGGSAREIFLEQVALAVLNILDGGPGRLPPLDLLSPLASTYFNHRESLLDHYRLLKEKHADIYDFSPHQLSMIGQILIERVGDRETAAVLFRLNVEEYPDSPLAHRDLGSLLLEDGSPDSAMDHLMRARELSPEPDADLDELIDRARRAISP